MAVYTDVSADDLNGFLASYDIGELRSYKGIAEGVENSNFLVHTAGGNFILTLYEKRVAAGDLPPLLLFSMDYGSAGRTPAIARRSARLWRGCISPAPISR